MSEPAACYQSLRVWIRFEPAERALVSSTCQLATLATSAEMVQHAQRAQRRVNGCRGLQLPASARRKKCPACGAGLTFVEVRGYGDLYQCGSGGLCKCAIFHFKTRGRACGNVCRPATDQWAMDRVRYVRGEGGMMRAPSQPTRRSIASCRACFQSSHTTLRRCQTWGERPNVIHTGWR